MSSKLNRERLPNTRRSVTHKFNVGGTEGYFTIGMFDDGRPGEIFVVIAKEGSTVAGLFDAISRAWSYMLQSSWTLDELYERFAGSNFAPNGGTTNKEIKTASSIVDYIMKWMKLYFEHNTGEEEGR